jgi:hypothetical protein
MTQGFLVVGDALALGMLPELQAAARRVRARIRARTCPPGPPGRLSVFSVSRSKSVCYGTFVWAVGRAGRLTTNNVGFRPGQ